MKTKLALVLMLLWASPAAALNMDYWQDSGGTNWINDDRSEEFLALKRQEIKELKEINEHLEDEDTDRFFESLEKKKWRGQGEYDHPYKKDHYNNR